MFSSDIPFNLHEKILIVLQIIWKYLEIGWNTKYFCDSSSAKVRFCSIIRQISFNVYFVFTMVIWFWETIYLLSFFFINRAIKWIIINFSVNIKFVTFLYYFFYPKLGLICLLQFFFIKCPNNLFTIKVLYYICPYVHDSIFNFFSNNNLFWPNILTWWPTLKLGSLSLFSMSKSVYVLDFTSAGFILLVLWYLLLY